MKIGFLIPSLKKRISARTSWKRVVRHNLGLKAPRGYGWMTSPRPDNKEKNEPWRREKLPPIEIEGK